MRWHLSIGLLCLAGLADAKNSAPVRSLLEMRQQNVVVQQWDTSCGAAALATLLRYQHGLAASEKEIADIERDIGGFVADRPHAALLPSLSHPQRAKHGMH